MNPTREDLLFHLALEKPGGRRAAFLEAMCEGDSALRQRLEALLAAHEESQGVRAEPAPAAKGTLKLELADIPDETVGQKIGRYKIFGFRERTRERRRLTNNNPARCRPSI